MIIFVKISNDYIILDLLNFDVIFLQKLKYMLSLSTFYNSLKHNQNAKLTNI